MNTLPTEWRPLCVEGVKEELQGFEDWVLCGGHSVALIVGRDTRLHGDIDVGVFRSQLVECLRVVGPHRVFLCRGGAHEPWTGGAVPDEVHDIWITDRDGKYWALQVMVYDDEGDEVVYRRDRRIRWKKDAHSIALGGIRVLNPLVTLLFKTNKPLLEDKDVHDVAELISTSKPGARNG